MKEQWEIRYTRNGKEDAIVLSDIHLVSRYEAELREEGIHYSTTYFPGKEIPNSDQQ